MALKKCTAGLPLFAFVSFFRSCSPGYDYESILDEVPTEVQVAVWKSK